MPGHAQLPVDPHREDNNNADDEWGNNAGLSPDGADAASAAVLPSAWEDRPRPEETHSVKGTRIIANVAQRRSRPTKSICQDSWTSVVFHPATFQVDFKC